MNKDQRDWLRALRSGEYPQAKGAMRRTIGANKLTYCCLGVECVLHYDEGEVEWAEGGGSGLHVGGEYYTTELPPELMERLRLTHVDTETLAELNDGDFTFEDIADILEHTFKDGSIDVAVAACELGLTRTDSLRHDARVVGGAGA